MRKSKEVFSAKTGTGTSTEAQRHELGLIAQLRQPVMAKLALTYGEEATITVKIQGLKLINNTWEDLDEDTFTTGSPVYLHATNAKGRHRRYRLNITANTEVTVDKAYIGVGTVEN